MRDSRGLLQLPIAFVCSSALRIQPPNLAAEQTLCRRALAQGPRRFGSGLRTLAAMIARNSHNSPMNDQNDDQLDALLIIWQRAQGELAQLVHVIHHRARVTQLAPTNSIDDS